MAATDPARAWRLADEAQRDSHQPQVYLFLALGLKPRDPAASERAFWKAIQGIDRQIEQGMEFSVTMGPTSWVLLPLVEQIDPTLVPELFWRAVAARPPIGNPRTLFYRTPTGLACWLGWYNREVAAAVFEPVRTELEQTDEQTLAIRELEFQAWSIFCPRRGGPARKSSRRVGARDGELCQGNRCPVARTTLRGTVAASLVSIHGNERHARTRSPVAPAVVRISW